MVSKSNTKQCVNKDVEPQKGVDFGFRVQGSVETLALSCACMSFTDIVSDSGCM